MKRRTLRRPRLVNVRRQIPDRKLWIHLQGRERTVHYVRAFEAMNALSSPPIAWGA